MTPEEEPEVFMTFHQRLALSSVESSTVSYEDLLGAIAALEQRADSMNRQADFAAWEDELLAS